MADINRTLDLIDGAIEDWATSNDAMRWTPEPGQRAETATPSDYAGELAHERIERLPQGARVWVNDTEVTDYVSELSYVDARRLWLNGLFEAIEERR